MPSKCLPRRDELVICFAHVAYRMGEAFARRRTGIRHMEVRSADELRESAAAAHVVVASGLWQNELLDTAPGLCFVQSISAGTDQYDQDRFRRKGVRLASAKGANASAVAEHAMALILALARQLHTGRDHQTAKHWRGMIGDPAAREDELGGKTLLIVGLGSIGARLARLAKAFDLTVIATKRDPGAGGASADRVHAQSELHALLPQADIVALTCPLGPETENLIDAAALSLMKPSAHIVNVARGRVVDEGALIEALGAGRIAAAGIDVTREEPLPPSSPLWSMRNVLLTPHTAGETRRYEDNVLDFMMENLERLWRGETELRNQVV
ncbi:MAG: D-2-hydroxyacid dehydrogenase [Hyphomicrobiaceae bacterium]|nr:D-2-hydroxyacid dehydrogenase [Hyphomicrobiaceae bacterium]